MAKAKNYGIMTSEEVIAAIERSKPKKLEIDMKGDFIPALTGAVRERNHASFRNLVGAYLSYILRTQNARPKYHNLVEGASDFVWLLCEDLDELGFEATKMFREYKPKYYPIFYN